MQKHRSSNFTIFSRPSNENDSYAVVVHFNRLQHSDLEFAIAAIIAVAANTIRRAFTENITFNRLRLHNVATDFICIFRVVSWPCRCYEKTYARFGFVLCHCVFLFFFSLSSLSCVLFLPPACTIKRIILFRWDRPNKRYRNVHATKNIPLFV